MSPRRSNVKIDAFRFWWNVTWFDTEMLKQHGRGEMALLFKKRQRAEEFARSLREGASEEVLESLSRARLT